MDLGAAVSAPVLRTEGLSMSFGGLMATRDVSIAVERGARRALIGPNGAGKTTLVNLLTGVLAPSAGRIVLDGADITALPAHRRVARGLVRTFQINQLFATLTPLQALALAVAQRRGAGARAWRPLGGTAVAERCDALLAEFHLADVMHRRTALLPYGKRRLLEIALAIACEPRVLLIEHDMDLVFAFARRITVLVDGAVYADGAPEAIAADPRVKAVYLGEAAHG